MNTNPERDEDEIAHRALSRMGASVVPAEDGAHMAARRERLVPELSRFADGVFANRKKRALRLRLSVAAGVFAACAALVVYQVHQRSTPQIAGEPEASLRLADGTVRLGRAGSAPADAASSQTPLWNFDRVSTEDGKAELSLRSGASVELGPRTNVQLGARQAETPIRETVYLSSGSIRMHVPKLGADGQFVVQAPDATVTVHGTVFTVEVIPQANGAPPLTTVAVSEGKVSVQRDGREIFLGPGSTWSSAGPEPHAAASAPSSAGNDGTDGATPAASAARPPGRTTLREENALFRAALAARKAGNQKRAIELVDSLLARYPESPLADAAKKERAGAAAALGATKSP